jgi:hypothetical protein
LRLRDLEKQAALEGITLHQAVNKYRYQQWKEFDFWLDTDVDPMTWDVLCKPSIEAILKDLYQLKKDLYFKNKPVSKDDITPDMIAQAKEYPVTSLVAFKGKVAHCINPNHTDKRPSMYLSPRINKATCGGCNKRFDAIDIVMTLEGLSWPDAVRKLCL